MVALAHNGFCRFVKYFLFSKSAITNKLSILQMCLMAEVKILRLMQNPMAKIASHKSFKERLNCSIFIFAIVRGLCVSLPLHKCSNYRQKLIGQIAQNPC